MKLPFISEKKHCSSKSGNSVQQNTNAEAAADMDFSESQSLRGLSELYSPEQTSESHTHDIVDILLDMGKINAKQRTSLRKKQKANPSSDVSALLSKTEKISTDDILTAQAKMSGLEFRHIEPDDIQKEAFCKLDLDYIKSNRIIPIKVKGKNLIVATSRPSDLFVIEDVKSQTQMNVETFVCTDEDIDKVCSHFDGQKGDYNIDDIMDDMADVEVVQDQEDDGVLFEMMESALKMHPAIVSRIKIMANLDISERRLPQDGKIKVNIGGRGIDLRVSTLPTNHGEKVVIRVLDSKSIMRGLEQLGMTPEAMATFGEQVKLPHGILLVTGPTGSGKSTTLYSALCQMDGAKLNISTVEDPVEYELDFCNQVQTNEKIGLDFASSLRSLLRQDPDVIMIGEIRDNETARIAVQAALTGHLVLSTLHTNDAASSITRLVDIGIDSYLIAASLNAVLAQRLVRKICPKCKKKYKVPEKMREYLKRSGIKSKNFYHGAGCEACRDSGYIGRVGIYELLVIDDEFRGMISKDSSDNNMRKVFHKSGCHSLFDDGLIKVNEGLTTIEEVLRVTEVYGINENEVFVENDK
jgi:type IV pilus assembly protein PilB